MRIITQVCISRDRSQENKYKRVRKTRRQTDFVIGQSHLHRAPIGIVILLRRLDRFFSFESYLHLENFASRHNYFLSLIYSCLTVWFRCIIVLLRVYYYLLVETLSTFIVMAVENWNKLDILVCIKVKKQKSPAFWNNELSAISTRKFEKIDFSYYWFWRIVKFDFDRVDNSIENIGEITVEGKRGKNRPKKK